MNSAQEPTEKPIFDDIVNNLRKEKGFLIDTVNEVD